MRTLSDAEFLDLWESGVRRHPLDRALLTLAAALPEVPYERLADWPIGRRNQTLTRLYCENFGSRLLAWTVCVQCGEKLEFEMNAELMAGDDVHGNASADERVTANEWTFRLPNSRDLARAVREADPVGGAVRIVESCLVSANPPAQWSEEDLSAIGEKLAMADPMAEMRLALHCPDCGNDWLEELDVVSFFWKEIEARGRQVLFAIHALASAYGWSQAEILSLSENRRAMYLEMAQA
jgi:hypothetical protein